MIRQHLSERHECFQDNHQFREVVILTGMEYLYANRIGPDRDGKVNLSVYLLMGWIQLLAGKTDFRGGCRPV
jgi:hypothetical protein